jgi:glycosyltransferase involved in cell wall biosynthesis
MGQLTFSVVVCTYNHAGLLPGVVDALARQTLDRSRYEIIVVDNNSSDDTRAVVEALGRRHAGLRYVFEPAQGLSHARNRGWKQAQGLYVAYIDDDCRPPAAWLSVADEILERRSPMVLGGPYHTAFEGPRPRWVSESFNSFVPFLEPRVLEPNQYGSLVGGNVFFRRSLFGVVGGFDPRLGHVGETLAYGDETAVLKEISDRFPGSLYYDPRLYVNHLVRPEKLTLGYNVRAAFGAGRSVVRRRGAVPQAPARLVLGAGATVLSLAVDILVRMLLRDRRRYPYPRNYLYGSTLAYVRRLGSLYEQGRLRRERESAAALK